MGEVRKYHVTHNGHRTIMRLNDVDVKNYPDAELVEGEATTDTSSSDAGTSSKARTAQNKGRTAASKSDS